MKEAARFCLDWLIEDEDGYLITAPSTSPENLFKTNNGPAGVGMASTMDMSRFGIYLQIVLKAPQYSGWMNRLPKN